MHRDLVVFRSVNNILSLIMALQTSRCAIQLTQLFTAWFTQLLSEPLSSDLKLDLKPWYNSWRNDRIVSISIIIAQWLPSMHWTLHYSTVQSYAFSESKNDSRGIGSVERIGRRTAELYT